MSLAASEPSPSGICGTHAPTPRTAWIKWLFDGCPGSTNQRWSQQDSDCAPTRVAYCHGAWQTSPEQTPRIGETFLPNETEGKSATHKGSLPPAPPLDAGLPSWHETATSGKTKPPAPAIPPASADGPPEPERLQAAQQKTAATNTPSIHLGVAVTLQKLPRKDAVATQTLPSDRRSSHWGSGCLVAIAIFAAFLGLRYVGYLRQGHHGDSGHFQRSSLGHRAEV